MADYTLLAIVVLVLMYFASSKPLINLSNNPDISDAALSFDTLDEYTMASVDSKLRVYKTGNRVYDLGEFDIKDATLSTSPNTHYRLYFFSGQDDGYYTDIKDYFVPANNVNKHVISYGCKIDTDLSFNARHNYIALTSLLEMTSYDSKQVIVEVSVADKKCYGMPQSPKPNAVCFVYDGLVFNTIEANTYPVTVPEEIEGAYSGNKIQCYEMPLLSNGDTYHLPITINTYNVDPVIGNDILVLSDDVTFSLSETGYTERFDYQGSAHGAPVQTLGVIQVG